MRMHHLPGPPPGHDPSMTTMPLPHAPQVVSRPEAIDRIREHLKRICDDEHCACAASAHFGLFCGGLRRLSDAELRKRFDWIANPRPHASREELERLVSLYHVSRQAVSGAALCCDVETREHCACDGWNQFDNPALEKIHRELTGLEIAVR